MRKTTLSAVCLLIAIVTNPSLAETYLPFTFDGMAEVHANVKYIVYEDFGNPPPVYAWDYKSDGPSPQHAAVSNHVTGYSGDLSDAEASISGTVDDEGLHLTTWLGVGSLWGDAYASASLTGTFSVSHPADVILTAEADPGYIGWPSESEDWSWQLSVWDVSDPSTILFQLDPNHLSETLTLQGNRSYGVDLFSDGWAFTSIDAHVQFSAVPEPAAMGLLALGGLAMLRRKRR